MRKLVGQLILSLVLASCSAGPSQIGTSWGPGAFGSNGERIYFTSTSERGGRISSRGGPGMGGMMMGGALTCASCHGPTGQGGRHFMGMQVMDASDIRWSALTAEEDADHGGDEDEHAGDYDLETFRMGVVEGKHPDGKPLKDDMPRWRMSGEDLSDLLDYLKTLP